MTVADEILRLVKQRPGITEPELAQAIFPEHSYQQRVNSTCRRLLQAGAIHRRGEGGPADPFRCYPGRGRNA
jgi:hypothetical protein